MQMLHTSLIAAIYYNLAVVLFSLISLSWSRGGSVLGIRDRTWSARLLQGPWELTYRHQLAQGWDRNTAKNQPLHWSHYTGEGPAQRAVKSGKKKKKEKGQQTGSAALFNSLRPGAVCTADVTLSLSEWSRVLQEQDGNRQR